MTVSLKWILAGIVSLLILANQVLAAIDVADSFSLLDTEVGCSSTFSLEARKAKFASDYQGRRMTWEGEISSADSLTVILNVDSAHGPDLSAHLRDPVDAHELQRGEHIRLNFTLDTRGDCYIPFFGSDAVIVR